LENINLLLCVIDSAQQKCPENRTEMWQLMVAIQKHYYDKTKAIKEHEESVIDLA
jgi:predicted NACHT family NTPase